MGGSEGVVSGKDGGGGGCVGEGGRVSQGDWGQGIQGAKVGREAEYSLRLLLETGRVAFMYTTRKPGLENRKRR